MIFKAISKSGSLACMILLCLHKYRQQRTADYEIFVKMKQLNSFLSYRRPLLQGL